MKPPRGLTIIELMATLAITGMLVAAALSVVAGMSRSEATDRTAHESSLLEAHLRELLATDVLHCGRYQKTRIGLELQGHAWLDVKTLRLEHLPSTVSYEVRQTGQGNWLVRTQESGSRGEWSELVCSGVSRIDLRPVGPAPDRTAGPWKIMPEAAIVAVTFEDPDVRAMEFTFRLR